IEGERQRLDQVVEVERGSDQAAGRVQDEGDVLDLAFGELYQRIAQLFRRWDVNVALEVEEVALRLVDLPERRGRRRRHRRRRRGYQRVGARRRGGRCRCLGGDGDRRQGAGKRHHGEPT